MRNFLKTKHSFSQAFEALKQGKRIRRVSENKGYGKLSASFDHYYTYWLEDGTTSKYCIFTIEDILADDWIID
jgi:hypothetical protein